MTGLTFLQTHVDAFLDSQSSKPVIRIYGTCLDGSPVICHITSFQPYFFITSDNLANLLQSASFISQLIVSFNIQSKTSKILRIERCYKQSVYGYTDSKSVFLKVFFNTFNGFGGLKILFENGITIANKVYRFSVYESHILYVLRFLIDKDISGMSYVQVKEYSVLQRSISEVNHHQVPPKGVIGQKNHNNNNCSSKFGKESIACQFDTSSNNYSVDTKNDQALNDFSLKDENSFAESLFYRDKSNFEYTNLSPQDKNERKSWCSYTNNDKKPLLVIASHEAYISPCRHEGLLAKLPPLKIISFDIECISLGDGFPDASKDPVIQIGNTICSSTDTENIKQYIFCLKKTASIPNAVVHSFENEDKLLESWYNFFVTSDPDIVTGYNIKGFDFPYLLQRAKILGLDYFSNLGRRYENNIYRSDDVITPVDYDILEPHSPPVLQSKSCTDHARSRLEECQNSSNYIEKSPQFENITKNLSKYADFRSSYGLVEPSEDLKSTDVLNKTIGLSKSNPQKESYQETYSEVLSTNALSNHIYKTTNTKNGSEISYLDQKSMTFSFSKSNVAQNINQDCKNECKSLGNIDHETTSKYDYTADNCQINRQDSNCDSRKINKPANLSQKNACQISNPNDLFADISEYSFSRDILSTTDLNLEGRIVFDMLQVVRKDVNLRSYTLNAVSVALLNAQKEDVPYHAMQGLFNGTPETRRRLASYCLVDTVLPLKLFKQLDVLENYAEMARVTGVPLSFLTERGQAVRVLSQILRKAKQKDFVVPHIHAADQTFEGGFVMDPERGFYTDPVAVLDFSSLYPSIMIVHNLCYSTLLPKKDILSVKNIGFIKDSSCYKNIDTADVPSNNCDVYTEQKNSSVFDKNKHVKSASKNSRNSKLQTSPIDLLNQKKDRILNTSKDCSESNYHTIEESEAVFEAKKEKPMINNNFLGFKEKDQLSSIITETPSGDYFVKSTVRKGLLPEILEELIAERKKTREILQNTKDPQLRASLDARQKALKISANSVYGFTGASQGQLPCLAISQSVTAFGRSMINQTKEVIEGKYNRNSGFSHNARVIYGDTDSVMIDFGESDIFEVFKLSRKVSKEVSATFQKPISLEFEKVYCPYLLMNKKRYAGLAYTDPGPDFCQNTYENFTNSENRNITQDYNLEKKKTLENSYKTLKKSENYDLSRNTSIGVQNSRTRVFPNLLKNDQSDDCSKSSAEEKNELSPDLNLEKHPLCFNSERIILNSTKCANFLSSTSKLENTKDNDQVSQISKTTGTLVSHKNPSISDLKGRIDTKGIETVRRDNCEMVRVAMETCLHLILFRKDIDAAINYVKETISDLFNNKIDLSQLVITKQMTKPGENYAVKQAHVQLASKLNKRDNTKINVGDRISYVIVRGKKNSPTYGRSEDPVFVLQNNLPIDTNYYLQNQLIKPIYRLFEPIIKNVSVLTTGAHTTESRFCVSHKGIAGSLSKKTECVGCRITGKIICKDCTPLFAKHFLTLQSEVNEKKSTFAKCWTQCQNCQGSVINEVLCVNRDCPIFYKRTRVKNELESLEEKFEKLSLYEW